MASPMPLSISVVIPTHQRPGPLRQVLDALACQRGMDLDRVEVVVVCDGRGDAALEATRPDRYPMRVRLVDQERQGPAAARNHGLALATNELIVFLDDDVVPGPDFLNVHARCHEQASDLVAIGPLLPPPGHGSPWVRWEGRTVAEQYAAMARGDWDVTPRQFYTGNASVRRIHLLNASGFDVTFPRGEDVELAFRLEARGLRFQFLPEAKADHRAARPYRSWVAMAESYGRFEVRMGRDRGQQGLFWSFLREFQQLNPWTRWLARAAIHRPLVGRLATGVALPVALLADRLHAPRVADAALSAAFNAVRLVGFAAEVGGARPALRLLDTARLADRPGGVEVDRLLGLPES